MTETCHQVAADFTYNCSHVPCSHTPDSCRWHLPEAHQRWLRWWYSRGRWIGWQRWTECGRHHRSHLGTRATSSWYPDTVHQRTCLRQAQGWLSYHKYQCRGRAIFRVLQNLGWGREFVWGQIWTRIFLPEHLEPEMNSCRTQNLQSAPSTLARVDIACLREKSSDGTIP